MQNNPYFVGHHQELPESGAQSVALVLSRIASAQAQFQGRRQLQHSTTFSLSSQRFDNESFYIRSNVLHNHLRLFCAESALWRAFTPLSQPVKRLFPLVLLLRSTLRPFHCSPYAFCEPDTKRKAITVRRT